MDLRVAARSARELMRHGMFRLGLGPRPAHNQTGSIAERFHAIYATGHWTVGKSGVPLSGEGSTLEATAELRRSLPAVLDRLGARTLLDVGCGDFFWMRTLDLPCDYIGVDVVRPVIEANLRDFGDARRRFLALDAIRDPLPPADVVLCREVLFHLSFAEARALLGNIVAGGCDWVMLTTDGGTLFNADIVAGGARLLNLEIAPFRLGRPDHEIDEGTSYRGRRIGVWRADRLAAALVAGPA